MDTLAVDWANFYLSRFLGGREIQEYFLEKKGMRDEMKNRLEKLNIKHNLNGIDKIISFTPEL